MRVWRKPRPKVLNLTPDDMREDGPIIWMTGETARDKQIGVEPPCSGSPNCSGAIHVRSTRPESTLSWIEIHLTESELEWLAQYALAAVVLHRELRNTP